MLPDDLLVYLETNARAVSVARGRDETVTGELDCSVSFLSSCPGVACW